MARQSIPRSDLYGDLGVDPSAETDAIEAAYRSLIDPLSGSDAAADVRRAARLRVAREWLIDPELRARYDASRARAAARAERAAAEEAEALAAAAAAAPMADAPAADAPDAHEEPAPSPAIPWPARDLDRQPAEIQWSSTPPEAREDGDSRRPGLRLGIVALLGLAAVVLAVTFAIAGNLGSNNLAANPTASPEQSVAASAPEPTTVATAVPSVAPQTAAPSAPPPSVEPSGVPSDVAAMQQAAWQTMESLRAAAETGDVAAAQAFLGDTAPGLRRSGLRRAAFPVIDATAIGITAADTGFVAIAGDVQLTSVDGVDWTFDYGDQPLAAYRSPSGEPVHDLWWEESDGEHHLFVTVSVATVSRTGVTVDVEWSFDPARPGDATYFRRSSVVISSATFDGSPIEIAGSAVGIEGLESLTVAGALPGSGGVPTRLGVGLTFTNPRTATSDDRAIETVFVLDVR